MMTTAPAPLRPASPRLFHRLAALVTVASAISLCPAQDSAAPATPPTSAVGLAAGDRPLPEEREIRTRVEAFFTAIESGEVSDAFTELLRGAPLGANNEEVKKLIDTSNAIIADYGAIRAHELLRVKRVGGRMIRFTYLTYSEDYPLRWEVVCYLSMSGRWQVLHILSNNSFQDLFDERD